MVNVHLALTPKAATALLGAVSTGRPLPEVLAAIVEEWARGDLGRVVR
jgi:hypothetical protein